MANNYRYFVPNESSILAPLHELLRQGNRWELAERQQDEEHAERVLAPFDSAAQLVLTMDVGPESISAVRLPTSFSLAFGRDRCCKVDVIIASKT